MQGAYEAMIPFLLENNHISIEGKEKKPRKATTTGLKSRNVGKKKDK